MAKESQTADVLEHLIKHGSITSMEAIKKYGCTRLSAQIFNFRKRGYKIDTVKKTEKNRYGNNTTYAVYTLISEPKTAV